MSHDITICSAALVRVGAEPITTLGGSGTSNTVCRTLYPSVVRDRLSSYRWRFATQEVVLERTVDVPSQRYSGVYRLPANSETVWRVEIAGYPIEYNIMGPTVHTYAAATDTVRAEVSFIPPEAEWPGYFQTLIELDLAAAIAVPITEDTQKANYYETKAMRHYAMARHLDASTRTARKIDMGGLRRLHGGRP